MLSVMCCFFGLHGTISASSQVSMLACFCLLVVRHAPFTLTMAPIIKCTVALSFALPASSCFVAMQKESLFPQSEFDALLASWCAQVTGLK